MDQNKMKRGEYYPTSLEKEAEEILGKMGIEYIPQYSTRTGFVIDFAVVGEDKKIAIEIDGTKWHSSKKTQQRDRFKDFQLRREGWKVIRIKEDEINKLEEILLSVTGNSLYLPKTKKVKSEADMKKNPAE
jgi:very-short-patch-repair endonuclease